MKSATAAAFAVLLVLFGLTASDGAASLTSQKYELSATNPAHAPLELIPAVRAANPTPVVSTFAHSLPESAPKAAYLPAPISDDALTEVVQRTCTGCHSDRRKQGNLTLESFDMASVGTATPEVAEKMIGKLRAGMMPPPGRKAPEGDTLQQLAQALEVMMDARYAANPNPGSRAFQRLNRAEYQQSIHDLLMLDIDASSWLPLDTKSANFDNIADVQLPSATTLDGYLEAASQISRLAVGDPKASTTSQTYNVARLASQLETVNGAPRGTRGGVSVVHTFPADGEYTFLVSFQVSPTGELYGGSAPFKEKIEISVNGERVALLAIDPGMRQADPNGVEMVTARVPVKAGPQRITATFLRTYEGPVNDLISPIGHSIADTQIGTGQSGITIVPHLQNFTVTGPFNPTGVSDTPSRRHIFSCRPLSTEEARPCAESIMRRLGAGAYRHRLEQRDVDVLMNFYDQAIEEGNGFEIGVRSALEALLSSPHFIFRMELVPEGAKPGERVAIDQLDLASRLSFFLWGSAPDSALLSLARAGKLSDTATLSKQTMLMLADPRAATLSKRFAAQWLRLQDLEKVHPDALMHPDFDEQLAHDMRRETEIFFDNLVRENRSLLEIITADYSFMNESLAEHYGVPGVVGTEFRRVDYPKNAERTGLLGHASILTLTSHANRTSPVLRGKWVMEVLMGTPPPPPPPDVPDLEKVGEAADGRFLTTREKMAMHAANASCNSCHQFMDPIGLALDNFDITGQWRIRENGRPLDTQGDFYDGTSITTPTELAAALMKRPTPIVRNFTLNLMAYAVGRRMEYTDQPAIRRIEAAAKKKDYKVDEFILGVVKSDAFRFKVLPIAQADAEAQAVDSNRGR